MAKKARSRVERDTMGEVRIPAGALWGANTERARLNLPISDRRMPWALLKALATTEVAAGRFQDQFPLDVFQTGSGTSSNMNVNEVVANLANEKLGGEVGEYAFVNPNDHVNFGQSSNDTIPSALHLAAVDLLRNELVPKLARLIDAWQAKAERYRGVVKTGRTHLQDALPITFGHVFRGYAGVLARAKTSLEGAVGLLCEIPLGGTAVGTGFQAPEGLVERAAEILSKGLGEDIRIAADPLVHMAGRPAVTDTMGRVASLAAEMHRIANDVRMMGSGPRLGIGELQLPSLQPGSSIMPGKVNPVVCESVVQVSLAVAGHHATVLAAAAGGQFELNVTFPVTAYGLLESIQILANACEVFRTRLVEGLEVREENVRKNLDQSLALATALISKIGYAEAAKVAYKAHEQGITVAEAVVKMGVLAPTEVDKWLDPSRLVKRGRIKD
jgi:fumarate hydratase class II